MDLYLAAALIALAALIAAGVTRLAVRGRTKSAVERALAESGQQRAKLEERLDARDRDVVRLESELAARGSSLEDESTRTAALRTRVGSLETLLEQERKAAQEKLQLLEEAKTKLLDAFKALSSEALAANSTSFLDLAETRFETLKQSAEQDLDTKKTAISTLLDPMSETLKKVEG